MKIRLILNESAIDKDTQRVIYREGQRYHREDGPAIIDYDQNGRVAGEEYYLAGRKYSKEQFIQMTGAKLESRIRINKFIIF